MDNNEPITVIAFLWGNWCGEWKHEYILRMAGMLERQMPVPYNFYVLNDTWSYCNPHLELPDWIRMPNWVLQEMPGNMKKLYAYHPDNEFSGRIIMVDLDMVFTGSLKPFTDYTGIWCGPGNLGRGYGLAGGGFVSFEKESCEGLWLLGWYYRNCFQGKERFFYRRYMPENVDTWQNVAPGTLYSYKWYVKKYGLPEDCRVVHFHGRPRPHEVRDEPFMKKYWSFPE